MLREFSNCYDKGFKQRIEDIQVGIYDNEKYNKISLELQEIRRKFIKKAPKDIKVLIQDYEELQNICRSILAEKLYEQGIEDGIEIAHTI